ncbi:MAG: 4-(cytidine 5'-diphospho)-2-C-methyl-D-erythritol kinase [Candidatus Marinimicrobia bacterium]|jgi:4-diphosphocytidyl-2-C-methyl-D-erythritol kinase|nr:4-(cytidine 5'-diphospho)-2-C-methyl-D-erythritol kinase [Candidatus Neomarinimicrobiota bacterium]
MTDISITSPAKVNIGLKILDQRKDGYHNIHTLFQELEFGDSVRISKSKSGCKITAKNQNTPTDESNTCFKAWQAIKEEYPHVGGVSIHLEKHIPEGSGLGGGSSNAATVLKRLNKLYSLDLSENELEAIALRIGADVPFFIRGGTQIGSGIGEKLTPASNKVEGYYLLVIPGFSVNTSWAYGQYKKRLEGTVQYPNFADLLEEDTIPFKLFENDFEDVVIPAHPEISGIKSGLESSGSVFAGLSGSGSTVFGIFSDDASAKEAEQNFKPQYRTVLTSPV